MTSAAVAERWAAEHVQPAAIGWDEHGRRIALDAPSITSVRQSWLRDHALGDMLREDGTLVLDDAGEHTYRPIRELPDGTTAYERT